MSKIKLSESAKEQLIYDLKEFVTGELDLEIGSLGSESLLDFIIEKVSPIVYNKAIEDAQSWYSDRFAELNLDSDVLLKEIK